MVWKVGCLAEFGSNVTANSSPNQIQDFVSEVVKHIQFLFIPGVSGPFLGPFPAVGLHPSCAGKEGISFSLSAIWFLVKEKVLP